MVRLGDEILKLLLPSDTRHISGRGRRLKDGKHTFDAGFLEVGALALEAGAAGLDARAVAFAEAGALGGDAALALEAGPLVVVAAAAVVCSIKRVGRGSNMSRTASRALLK